MIDTIDDAGEVIPTIYKHDERLDFIGLDEAILLDVEELTAHLDAERRCIDWCSHCHENWEIRQDWLGIEGVNLHAVYQMRCYTEQFDDSPLGENR